MLTFTFLSRIKWERTPFGGFGMGHGRKMIPPQTSSSLCKARRWYADLAVGWHLKVVNCANLCFRLERSWIVSLSSWTNPLPSSAQLQRRRGGGVCWFLHWPPCKVAQRFSRWFMNIYMHKLCGKLNCGKVGSDSAICFTEKKCNSIHSGWECSIVVAFLIILNVWDIKLSVLCLYEGRFCFIAVHSSSYYSSNPMVHKCFSYKTCLG